MNLPLQDRPVFVTLADAPCTVDAQIVYDPKHSRTKFRKWFCIARVDRELIRYYQWWIWRFCNEKLTDSAWKPHCTLVRGEKPPENRQVAWRKYEGAHVKLHYSPAFLTNGTHWWLPATSPQLEAMRKELGLRPTPYVPFHITIGAKAY